MHALKFTDPSGLFIVTVANDRDSGLHVTACYHFRPGRTSGELISTQQLPSSARQLVSDLTNNNDLP